MSPERWSQIKETFDQALDEPPELRSKLVHTACIDDPDLEVEVMRLLHAHVSSGSFLDQPVAALNNFLQTETLGPALQRGTILARRFEIRNFINAGGMGEVYEAWDADLSEAVAIKTILPRIAANADIIERFKHEVRHAREVSHPNICRVHELFCDDSETGVRTWFLSMELLRGTTLLERIRRGGSIPADTAALIAAQLLSGLEAAHARGLVHRDFKSSNVMLIEEDDVTTRAVITDFGLAIRSLPDGNGHKDAAGTGTPGYMAPEQERGDEIGPLADQYAFGVVLCEMMTGSLPKPRGSRLQRGIGSRISSQSRATGASHASQASGPMATPKHKGYPAVWQIVIRRCLEVEPAARFRDMAAVQSVLFPSILRRQRGWLIAAGFLLTAALVAAMGRKGPPPAVPCSICDVTQLTPDTDKSESPSLSADGRFVAYSSDRAETGNIDIFVQALPSGQLRRITRDSARDTTPSLSPDGSVVAYRSERAGGGVYLGNVGDEAEPKLLVAGGRNPKIAPDGKSLLYWTGDSDSSVESGKVFRIDLQGGKPQRIASHFPDARYPVWSTDGQRILFTGCSTPGQQLPACFDWWVGDVSSGAALEHDVPRATHAYTLLRALNFLPGRLSSLEWRGDHLIFSAVGMTRRLNLAVLTLDPKTLAISGTPRWLLQADGGDVEPSVAEGNRIAFTRTTGALHVWRLPDPGSRKKANFEKVTADADVDGTPAVSEGGRFLVFSRGRSLKRTIVMRDLSSGEESTVVNAGTPVQAPIVDRDGRWVAYQQTETDGSSAIYAGQAGGGMKRICENCSEPSAWFGGNKAFFFRDSPSSISMADPRTGQMRVVVRRPGGLLGDLSWSPAISSLVLLSSTSAVKQLEVIHLDPETGQPDGDPITTAMEKGTPVHPRWLGEGKEIVYVSNRDGFLCLYGRMFRSATRTFGEPFAITHFHGQRASIDDVQPRAFNLSVAGEVLYLNLGEQNSTIQTGQLASSF